MREEIKITLLKNLLDEITKKYDYFISLKERILEETYEKAIKDHLTGIYNRYYVMDDLEKEIERTLREGTSFTIVSFDLDNFKPINDKYGHLKGDEILKKVADVLKDSFRFYDIVGRLGGDEFIAIVFGDYDIEERLQKIRKEIENILPEENLSISYGILKIPTDIKEILEDNRKKDILKYVLDKVDRVLYENKKVRKGLR
jgi:diguanylate cyclase (GGDEF)-like protein